MKRVRKFAGSGVRFFGCGEYGDRGGRPHYHGLLFGLDFEDKKLWSVRDGYRVYKSDQLEKLWPLACLRSALSRRNRRAMLPVLLEEIHRQGSR